MSAPTPKSDDRTPTQSKSETKFSIYYDTSETDEHTMGAKELGQAMIALDEALEQSYRLINGEESIIEVKVAAPEPGSIGIPVVVEVLNNLDIASIIGFTGAIAGSATVIETLAYFRKRKIIDVVRHDNGKSTVTVSGIDGEHEPVELDTKVEMLVTDKVVRDKLNRAIFSPVKTASEPKVLIKDFEGEETLIELDEESVRSITKLPRDTMLVEEEQTDRVHVRFINIDFESYKNWKVDYLGQPLTVKITDELFIQRNQENVESFKSGDLFEVQLDTIIKTQPNAPTRHTYVISRVYRKVG